MPTLNVCVEIYMNKKTQKSYISHTHVIWINFVFFYSYIYIYIYMYSYMYVYMWLYGYIYGESVEDL